MPWMPTSDTYKSLGFQKILSDDLYKIKKKQRMKSGPLKCVSNEAIKTSGNDCFGMLNSLFLLFKIRVFL